MKIKFIVTLDIEQHNDDLTRTELVDQLVENIDQALLDLDITAEGGEDYDVIGWGTECAKDPEEV
jgi:hypothetical protein